jgi:hypothetical protein
MGSLVHRGLSAAAIASSERPAISLVFEIAGRFVLVESLDDAQPAGLDQLLAGFYVTPAKQSGSVTPDAIIEFRRDDGLLPCDNNLDRFEVPGGGYCYTDGRSFWFDFESARVVVHPAPSRCSEILVKENLDLSRPEHLQVFNYAISASLRRCGIYELHSAAVLDPQTRAGVIFVGPSGSGKSTITLQLAAAGWPYLTDDILLLSSENGIVEAKPLRRAFAVTESSVSASGHAVLAESMGRFERFGESKKRFSPHDFFSSGFAASCVPGVIYFPAVTDNRATDVRALSQSETMVRLLKMCPWASYDRRTGSTHLQILATLARQCAGYDLAAGGDVLTDPSLLPRLIATGPPGD